MFAFGDTRFSRSSGKRSFVTSWMDHGVYFFKKYASVIRCVSYVRLSVHGALDRGGDSRPSDLSMAIFRAVGRDHPLHNRVGGSRREAGGFRRKWVACIDWDLFLFAPVGIVCGTAPVFTFSPLDVIGGTGFAKLSENQKAGTCYPCEYWSMAFDADPVAGGIFDEHGPGLERIDTSGSLALLALVCAEDADFVNIGTDE